MYQSYFGLHTDPFALGPKLRFLFRSHAHAETMAHLGYGLEQGEDIILITGAIGTGKTLALQNLQAKVSRLFHQVLVNVTNVNFAELLKLVLHELDVTWPPTADTADLLCLLKDRALALYGDGKKLLLVVDEAQNLDAETLEGVRLLCNIGQPSKQIFQIVLAGQPSLEHLIARRELAQLRQRIRIHYRLEPLTAAETGEYLTHRLAVAGRRDPLFSAAAIAKIHELSCGVPRLVNHLASHALLAAFVDKDNRVEPRHIAAEDLPEVPVADLGPAPTPLAASSAPPAETIAAPKAERGPVAAPASERTPAEAEETAEAKAPARASARSAPSATAPRPRTLREARAEARKAQPRRPVRWSWIWPVVILIGAVGAWALLRDQAASRSVPRTSGLVPRSGRTVESAAPSGTVVQPAGEPAETAPATAPANPADQSPAAATTAAPGSSAPAPGAVWREAGAPVAWRPVVLPDGSRWLRAVVGPLPAPAAADSTARSLEAAGLITFHQVLTD